VTGIPLVGGDVNVVVRVGDTVRRPPEPPGVVALLQWYEHASLRWLEAHRTELDTVLA
jgi:hypothetical protein